MKVRAEQIRIGDCLYLGDSLPDRRKIVKWLELDNTRKVITVFCEGPESSLNPGNVKVHLQESEKRIYEFDVMVTLMEPAVKTVKKERKQFVVDIILAKRLGEMAAGWSDGVPGWNLLDTWEEGKKYGYNLHAIFHRSGDSKDEYWETSFDFQGENELYVYPDCQTFYPRKRVVVETVSWILAS